MTLPEEYAKECVFASLPRTTRGMPLVISGSPDGKKFLYCNGNSVYIRNVDDITECDIYTEHPTLTTIAKYSPSGFYIASGDQSGKTRLWDATQATHVLKSEYQFINGPIRDISWSDDSKRMAIVGEGHERFGHVFLFDTGTSNGNLSGQSRPMISVDFRPTKPYKIVTGSEDNTVAIFEGPPFKFKTLFHEHTRFVNTVRYNKDGSLFCSGGADGKVVLFEGVEGSKVGEFVDDNCKGLAHGGGVFALCWSPDSLKIATASGDKTAKIWNASDRTLLKKIEFGKTINDQQIALAWLTKKIVTVSLSGFLNYIDAETLSISNVVMGHNKSITSMVLSNNKQFIFTADFEGNVVRWKLDDGSSERVNPTLHKSQISGMAITASGTLVSVGWDDAISFTPKIMENIENVKTESMKLSSQPRGVALSGNKIIVAAHKSIIVLQDAKVLSDINTKFEGTCVSAHEGLVAIGGNDSKLRIYELSGNGVLTEKKVLQHQQQITAVEFSPNGKYVVASDAGRKVVPYNIQDGFKAANEKEWTYHNAKINCVSWSENSRYIATGGIDTNIIVWDIEHSGEHPIIIKGAHPMSQVNCVAWIETNKVVTAGQDSNIKKWCLKNIK